MWVFTSSVVNMGYNKRSVQLFCISPYKHFKQTFSSVARKMILILLLILTYLVTFAITTPIAIPRKDLKLLPEFTIEILKQIHKINCDGSYSFGFKVSDGTFLVEQKNADGYVSGEFGRYANPQFQLSEHISGFNIARQLIGFPVPATENKAFENRTSSSVFKILENSGNDIPIDVENSSEVQKAENEKQKNLHNPNRPKFFKFGEAIFRYQSNDSKSEMLPTLPSPIDKFIQDLKIRKLYPSDENISH